MRERGSIRDMREAASRAARDGCLEALASRDMASTALMAKVTKRIYACGHGAVWGPLRPAPIVKGRLAGDMGVGGVFDGSCRNGGETRRWDHTNPSP
jgi:hypothetical protein